MISKKIQTSLTTLLLTFLVLVMLAERSTNYFVGDLSHLTLNSSYNIFKFGEYSYGNINNFSSAVKNSPLLSIILSIVYELVFSFFNLSPRNLVYVSIYLVNIFFLFSFILFFDIVKQLTNYFTALLITFLFFLNPGILNSILKISSESVGVLLIIAWIDCLIRFNKTNNINYFYLLTFLNSLFFLARYQLLIIHIYGLIILINIAKKNNFNMAIAFTPLLVLFANFYYNYISVSNILGHPSGVKGDPISELMSRFANLILEFFNYSRFGFLTYLLIVIIFGFILIYLSKETIQWGEFLKNIYSPNLDFIFFFTFFIANSFLLILTLSLNKADSLSFRYTVYYFIFLSIALAFITYKFKTIKVILIIIVFSNLLSLQNTFSDGGYLNNCHCSDFSPQTINYIENNLKTENILASRYLTQLWYSDYKGLVLGLPFYSDYNKAYERDLYLKEERFLELIAKSNINYIVFFEGKDKVDKFAKNNSYGDFIGKFYLGDSIYIESIVELPDGKIIKLNR